MMSKIALITDSTSDLSPEIIEKYNIQVLSFKIIYKDREYVDGIEITPEDVYDRLKIEVPTTALPSLKDMHDLYKRLETEGYTHAIIVTLSSGLSGIHNAVTLVSQSYPNIQSYVYDSKSISLGEAYLVEECGKMIQAGKDFQEIIAAFPIMKKKMHLFFVVGTLEYLVKGGRIGRVVGTIGDILNIKPIISIGESDGKYYTVDKVRGRKRSLKRLKEIGQNILAQNKCQISVMSGAAKAEGQQIAEEFARETNAISVCYGGAISPVAGVHSGPGLVGVLLVED